VAYEKLKLKDGKDVEIYENLDIVYLHGHGPSNPTTLEDESILKSLLVGTSGILLKRFLARNSDMILVPTMGCAELLQQFPLTNKAWSWKVKESKLLWKNVSLPLTIPLMVLPWGKLLLCTFHAVISSMYCHNPQI
jgi:hypothetical protein